MPKKKIKYGKVDLLPETFDPKKGFIRLDIFDRVKNERDRYRSALQNILDDVYEVGPAFIAEYALKNKLSPVKRSKGKKK